MLQGGNIKRRRSIRLENYDYSWPGFYFVTICVNKKKCCLGDVVYGDDKFAPGEVKLSEIGKIVKDTWLSIPDYHKAVELDEYIIMPNHIHGIIIIKDIKNRRGDALIAPERGEIDKPSTQGIARNAPTRKFIKQPAGSLSTIVGSFKSAVSKQIHLIRGRENFQWQRNYYERIIRNERSLDKIRRYIRSNPNNW